MKTIFLRAIEADDKAAALLATINEPVAALGKQRFDVDPASFVSVPRSPFSYWVSDDLRRLFIQLPPFESEGRQAQRALSTNNDFRYLRLAWERLADIAFERPASGWLPFAKGGAFSPYYSDVHLLVKWIDEGREIEAEAIQKFPYLNGNAEWVMHRECNYLRPGLTWPIKNRFSLKPWPLPAGCIFAHVGPSAFIKNDDTDELSATHALMSSSIFTALVRIMAGWNFEVGIIQRTPLASASPSEKSVLARLARRAWLLKRRIDTSTEISHAFTLPAQLQVVGSTLADRASTWAEQVSKTESELTGIQREIDSRCFDLYGINGNDRISIAEGFIADASESGDLESEAGAGGNADVDTNEDSDFGSKDDAASLAAELVSWAVGVAFGRFDVRLATGLRPLPKEPEPFDPLPVCPPAMLTGDDGLPLTSAPPGYRVTFPANGILVDDRGHARDLATSVRVVFDEIFKPDSDEWWNEMGALLDPKRHDLRAWLTEKFFEHHLKRYSKSRRKAPIIWQLSVPSGRYSVWLYAHRLTRDSLFQIQNDVVAPKLAHEERQLASLIQGVGANPSAKERLDITRQETFVEELRAFLDEVKRVAPLWNPMPDDGVALTKAPLWRLVPQHKPWQKELKSKWNELAAGKYDWASVAMHLWPERVILKCTKDRSLAIAHGLEDIFWVEADDGEWKPLATPTRSIDVLVRERTSVAVKAALKGLIESSASNGPKARARRSSS
jgi:hypothetical protein